MQRVAIVWWTGISTRISCNGRHEEIWLLPSSTCSRSELPSSVFSSVSSSSSWSHCTTSSQVKSTGIGCKETPSGSMRLGMLPLKMLVYLEKKGLQRVENMNNEL